MPFTLAHSIFTSSNPLSPNGSVSLHQSTVKRNILSLFSSHAQTLLAQQYPVQAHYTSLPEKEAAQMMVCANIACTSSPIAYETKASDFMATEFGELDHLLESALEEIESYEVHAVAVKKAIDVRREQDREKEQERKRVLESLASISVAGGVPGGAERSRGIGEERRLSADLGARRNSGVEKRVTFDVSAVTGTGEERRASFDASAETGKEERKPSFDDGVKRMSTGMPVFMPQKPVVRDNLSISELARRDRRG